MIVKALHILPVPLLKARICQAKSDHSRYTHHIVHVTVIYVRKRNMHAHSLIQYTLRLQSFYHLHQANVQVLHTASILTP